MNFLYKIISKKKEEIRKNSKKKSIEEPRKCLSLSNSIRKSKTGIIAEFKRISPTKVLINERFFIEDVVIGYENAGASGVSVLTDDKYFSARNADLPKTRRNVSIPILRKDFIIDESQIIASKAIGADAVLFIAEILSKEVLIKFVKKAKNIGLDVIMELHSSNELEKIPLELEEEIDFIGVNNRNLKNFSIDIECSVQLSRKINFFKISESGISNLGDIFFLKKLGFHSFLIGESFMNSSNPWRICEKIIQKMNNIPSYEFFIKK
ncbi:MAG TPA: indole-3-glycerol phosphate synthase TrpC [Candidatus Angelobacter sp.]|jgi:indole-3-glycerol phosphate synthase|nr:indole-3-glycerol phosphate synthase TrpC [Candidatus Angelobacter sp.]